MLPLPWRTPCELAPPLGAPQFASMNRASSTLMFVQNAEPISLFCPDETDGESLSAVS